MKYFLNQQGPSGSVDSSDVMQLREMYVSKLCGRNVRFRRAGRSVENNGEGSLGMYCYERNF